MKLLQFSLTMIGGILLLPFIVVLYLFIFIQKAIEGIWEDS